MSQSTTPSRPGGISSRMSLIMALIFGAVVMGPVALKWRHVNRLAERASWHSADFRVDRPQFDRIGFESDPSPLLGHALKEESRERFLIGMAQLLRGAEREALSNLTKASQGEPNWPTLRFYLGATRLRMGHPVAAVADLQFARERGFQPPEGAVEWWLGLAHLYCGDKETGSRMLAQVVTIDPAHASQASEILTRLETRTNNEP